MSIANDSEKSGGMGRGGGGGDGRKVTSLRDLPISIQPPRDLWAGIEARIAEEGVSSAFQQDNTRGQSTRIQQPASLPASGVHRAFWNHPSRMRAFAAAAIIAALAIGIWVGRGTLPLTGKRPVGNGMSASVSTEHGQTIPASYMLADPRYQRARADALKALQAQLQVLSPDTRAKVIKSLDTIHQSMKELEAALGRDPSNALLQELLVNTYQDEMRVVTAVRDASETDQGI